MQGCNSPRQSEAVQRLEITGNCWRAAGYAGPVFPVLFPPILVKNLK